MDAQPARNWITKAWSVPGLDDLECFRAQGFTHHFDRHSHETYAIGVIECGVGGTYYRRENQAIPAGDIFVIQPDEVHSGYEADGQPLHYAVFYVGLEMMKRLLPDNAPLPYFADLSIHDPHWSPRLIHLLRLLETPGDALLQAEYFTETLAGFVQTHGSTRKAWRAGNEHDAVARVRDYIHARYAQHITLDDLAALTHLNRAYLIRTFRQTTGLTPYRYLIQVRVEHAQQLLGDGMAAADVAYAVGFADQSHLTRQFKRITGTTPKRYATGHYRSRNRA